MISNQIPWDLKRTKTNKEENCFVFTLFSVFLLKYCTRLEKNNMYTIQLCKMGNENDILDFLRRFIGYHDFKSNPLGFKKNQNKQGEKLFCVHIVFCFSIEILCTY